MSRLGNKKLSLYMNLLSFDLQVLEKRYHKNFFTYWTTKSQFSIPFIMDGSPTFGGIKGNVEFQANINKFETV